MKASGARLGRRRLDSESGSEPVSFWPRLLKGLAAAAGACLAIVALAYIAPLPGRLQVPPSTEIRYRDGSPAYFFLSPDDKWRLPIALKDVDRNYLKALLRFEDKRFYFHFGVDPLALCRAAYLNQSRGRIVSGGSTITMQLARILKPRPRTYSSKAIEALRALQLEIRMSKKQILAAYLQYLPFGRNIEGIESACYAFFGHSSQALSPFEIAYLLSIPQDPNPRFPSTKNLKLRRKALKETAARLEREKIFTPGVTRAIMQTPLPEAARPFPRNAPHSAFWLGRKFPEQTIITASLGKDLQQLVEKTLAAYRAECAAQGVYNAAVVVIDNKTSELLAAAGNFDFWDSQHQGQVIGFLAPRSPGSTLKPFIYAMAIDQAIALPSYLVPDLPTRFGGYQPKNYDDSFRGLVRLEDALAQSLNVPFINLLDKIKVEPFLSLLSDCGVTTLRKEPGYYGLSIAVGSIDLNLLELSNLYAMLAREGQYLDYQLTPSPEKQEARQVLSAPAGYLTRKALSIRDRPDFPTRREVAEIPPRIHWKTGTSSGHKDAWAIGSNPEFTVGVWLGNFDGTPSIALTGAQLAGPVLFDLLDALSNRAYPGPAYDLPPQGLAEIDVCAYSGFIPNKHCPETRKALAPIKNLPTKTCPYHQNYQIDVATGYYLPPGCRQGRAWSEKTFVVLPATVRRWISDQQLLAPRPPSPLPDCKFTIDQAPPKIIAPQQNAVFFLVPGLGPDKQEIPLEAETGNRESELSWFVNGKLLAKAPAQERVWLKPEPGEQQIRVVDYSGQFDQVKIKIISAD